MDYEEIVEMIAHLKAAQAVVGLEDIDDRIAAIMAQLHLIEIDLNNMRLEALGNGRERPFTVSDIIKEKN